MIKQITQPHTERKDVGGDELVLLSRKYPKDGQPEKEIIKFKELPSNAIQVGTIVNLRMFKV